MQRRVDAINGQWKSTASVPWAEVSPFGGRPGGRRLVQDGRIGGGEARRAPVEAGGAAGRRVVQLEAAVAQRRARHRRVGRPQRRRRRPRLVQIQPLLQQRAHRGRRRSVALSKQEEVDQSCRPSLPAARSVVPVLTKLERNESSVGSGVLLRLSSESEPARMLSSMTVLKLHTRSSTSSLGSTVDWLRLEDEAEDVRRGPQLMAGRAAAACVDSQRRLSDCTTRHTGTMRVNVSSRERPQERYQRRRSPMETARRSVTRAGSSRTKPCCRSMARLMGTSTRKAQRVYDGACRNDSSSMPSWNSCKISNKSKKLGPKSPVEASKNANHQKLAHVDEPSGDFAEAFLGAADEALDPVESLLAALRHAHQELERRVQSLQRLHRLRLRPKRCVPAPSHLSH